MKISRNWLQTFFDAPLPSVQALSDALTFHAFEIEGVQGDVLDVKVTPNRGHDCLSHRGIAREVSAILNIPIKNDPLRETVSLEPRTDLVSVSINTPQCSRYIAGYIKNVKVGPSPTWLIESLEAIGQHSINNIVDAANYVMFNIGQPLHAFDASKLVPKRGQSTVNSGQFGIQIRNAKKGEDITCLDGKEYELHESMLVIADGNADTAVGIAGVKGGKAAEVNETTTDIIIESANFDGVSVRRTAQALKLRTDASSRFEQVISPELAAYGMREVVDLILKIAGGELVGFADEYPNKQKIKTASVSLEKTNRILGTEFTADDVASALNRLGLSFEKKGDELIVTSPFERLDLLIPGDIVEEIGRIEGYEKIPNIELSAFSGKAEINSNFYAAEKAREELVAKGYSEVFTSVFADRGERIVANKVDGVRPFLRSTLVTGLEDALKKNVQNKDLLGLKKVRLFEIGIVWNKKEEQVMFGTIEEGGKASEKSLELVEASAYGDFPISQTEHYQSFSKYPYIVRDIALWVPSGTKHEQVLDVIRVQSGELLVRSALFDTFEKEGKVSYAFRLVFQSFDRTLTDDDANTRMESVYSAVKEKGWQVR